MASNETTQLINPNKRIDDEVINSYESFFKAPNSEKCLINCVYRKNAKICCQLNDIINGNDNWTHCHSYDKTVGIDKTARRKLIFACILCSAFMTAEIVGGLMANSLAIAADAAHLLTDLAGFLISLFAVWMATRPESKSMSFGWHRAEVIGALTSVLLIWVVTGVLCFIAVQRILNNDYEIDSQIMLITSSLGVVVNVIMGVQLQIDDLCGGDQSHKNDDNNDHNNCLAVKDKPQVKKQNINVRAAFIHILGDFVQSVGVLIAALIIYFRPDLSIVDPLCTFLFSILVLITTSNILRDVFNILLEATPRGINYTEVHQILSNIPGVKKVHNLRIWSLSMDKTALSTHLAIEKGKNANRILKLASHEIKSQFDIFEITIQIEQYKDVMNECGKCLTNQH